MEEQRSLTEHLPNFPAIFSDKVLSAQARLKASELIDKGRKRILLSQDEEDFLRIYARVTKSKKTKFAVQQLNIHYEEEETESSDFSGLEFANPDFASRALNYLREAEKDRFNLTIEFASRTVKSHQDLIEFLSKELDNERRESRRKDEMLIKILGEKSIDFDFSSALKDQFKDKLVSFLISETQVPKDKAPSVAEDFFRMLFKAVPAVVKSKFGVDLDSPTEGKASEAA